MALGGYELKEGCMLQSGTLAATPRCDDHAFFLFFAYYLM
jgi:hypothetical protein